MVERLERLDVKDKEVPIGFILFAWLGWIGGSIGYLGKQGLNYLVLPRVSSRLSLTALKIVFKVSVILS